jgi:hypothetical protein
MLASLLPLLVLTTAMLLLPPLGALLGGLPLGEVLAFPLAGRAWDPLPPSDAVLGLACAAAGGALLVALWRARPRPSGNRESVETTQDKAPPSNPRRAIRLLVWGGLLLGAALALALAGQAGLSQPVLVLGLTLGLAGHTDQRTGASLLTKRPGFVLLLFPVSALLGWLFHWLNLFLQLWVYPGSGGESAIPFVLVRTLDYATLLPALLTLRQWLASWRPLRDGWSRARPLSGDHGDGVGVAGRRHAPWPWLTLAGLGLAGAAIWPDWIWPLSWCAPLLLAIGLQRARGRPSLFAGIRRGDWTRVLLPGLAALLLGLLIQGWNSLVGPVWMFQLPLIQGLPLLGLPLPAYAGLPPLGLLGLWVADQLAHPWRRRPLGRFRPFPVRLSIKG